MVLHRGRGHNGKVNLGWIAMSRTALLVAAILVSQAAEAADLHSHVRYHHRATRTSHRYVEQNNVIHCTTANVFGFFSYASCGQGFDPLASATN